MDQLERLTALKERVNRLQREADKSQGALERILAQLKEEFGCDSLEKAGELLSHLESKERRTRKKFERVLAKFERDWDGKLPE